MFVVFLFFSHDIIHKFIRHLKSVFIKKFESAFSMTFVKSEIIRFLKVNKIPLDMSKSEKYTKNNL